MVYDFESKDCTVEIGNSIRNKRRRKKTKNVDFLSTFISKIIKYPSKNSKKLSFFRKLFCHRVKPKELRGQCPNLQDFKQSLGWGMHFCFFFACLVFEVLQWEVRWEYVCLFSFEWPLACNMSTMQWSGLTSACQ